MIRTALYRVPKLSSRRGLPSKPAFLFSSPASRFDEKLASILASYSFEAYNEAFVGKPAKIADGSKVFFTSLQHIRKIFTGAMIVTIKNVKLTKFKPKNSQIAERIISGSKADPYVVATVINGYTELYNENQLSGTSTVDDDSFSRFCSSENQVLDRCRSTTKRNSNDAVWNGLNGRIGESYALYFQDNRAASMTFTVFDEEVFSGDILIGNALLSNQELEKLVNYSLDSDASEFDLPIFQSFENEAGTLIQSLKSLVPGSIINPRSQIGSLGISVKYMPWSSLSDEQICSLVVLGDTEFAFSNAIVNNVKEDWMKTFWKNKPSEWSNMLNTAAQNQLPSIPMPSDVFNPAEGTLLNHASSALQQLQFKFAQPRNVGDDTSANSTGESMKNIVTLDKNEMFQSAFLPRGATPDVANWTLLLQHLLQNKECEPNVFSSDAERKIWESLENGTMCQIAAIDNPETDTQAAIWADSAARSLIISFRGTELTRIKDILTDINVFQTSFLPNHPNLANVQFHEGFLTAYSSVQLSLLQHLYDIFSTPSSSKYRNWTIFITGHSLGGALATVCAFDLGRIRAGMVASATPPKWYHSLFSSGNGIISEKHRILLEGLQASELVVYTYGAPRVGDLQFKQLFDRWIPNCFRVVNGHDIIARMPRNVSLPFAVDPPAILNHKSKETQMEASKKMNKKTKMDNLGENNSTELKYAHVGRTVLIDETYIPTMAMAMTNSSIPPRRKGIWVEQESVAQCPLAQEGNFFIPNSALDNAFSGLVSSLAGNKSKEEQSVLNAQISAATTLVLNQLIEEMQKQLKPTLTNAMEKATKNVNAVIERSFGTNSIPQNIDKSSFASQFTDFPTSNTTSWGAITEILMKNLRGKTSSSTYKLSNKLVSDGNPSVGPDHKENVWSSQWRLLETSLLAWKPSVTPAANSADSVTLPVADEANRSLEQQRWKQVLDAASTLGVDTAVLERELGTLATIWDHSAILNHLEPAYYQSICKVAGCEELVARKETSASAESSSIK